MCVYCVDVSLLLVVNVFLIGPITLVSRKTIAYCNSYSTAWVAIRVGTAQDFSLRTVANIYNHSCSVQHDSQASLWNSAGAGFTGSCSTTFHYIIWN